MKQVWQTIWDHRGKAWLTAYFIFTTAVHTMPMSLQVSHPWFYSFLHALAGGLLDKPNGVIQ